MGGGLRRGHSRRRPNSACALASIGRREFARRRRELIESRDDKPQGLGTLGNTAAREERFSPSR